MKGVVRFGALVLTLSLSLTASAEAQYQDNGQELDNGWKAYLRLSAGETGLARSLDLSDAALYTAEIGAIARTLNGKWFLLAPGVTYAQVYEIVGKFLDANSDRWNQDGILLAIAALQQAFPLPTFTPVKPPAPPPPLFVPYDKSTGAVPGF